MSNTVADMAREFVKLNGRKLSHRSVTLRYPLGSPNEYLLHGHVIARIDMCKNITFDWCGWYTRTTAAHMNEILRAANKPIRVSYSQARDAGITTFDV